MIGVNAIAEIASLLGDPARANILFALKEDGQVSSGDLAIVAGVAPSTASEHLAKLVDAEEWNKYWEFTETDEDYLSEDPKVKNSGISGHVGVSF